MGHLQVWALSRGRKSLENCEHPWQAAVALGIRGQGAASGVQCWEETRGQPGVEVAALVWQGLHAQRGSVHRASSWGA